MVVAAALFAAMGCGGGGDGGDDDTLGAIEVTGNWNGATPDGVMFDVAVFACPFTMPPESFPQSPEIDAASGDVHDLVEDVSPGEWCLMAYIDMDPDDGLAPVAGLDAVNATGAENANGAIALDVVAGEITPIDLVFELY